MLLMLLLLCSSSSSAGVGLVSLVLVDVPLRGLPLLGRVRVAVRSLLVEAVAAARVVVPRGGLAGRGCINKTSLVANLLDAVVRGCGGLYYSVRYHLRLCYSYYWVTISFVYNILFKPHLCVCLLFCHPTTYYNMTYNFL